MNYCTKCEVFVKPKDSRCFCCGAILRHKARKRSKNNKQNVLTRLVPFTNTTSAREVANRFDPLQSYIQDIYDKLGYQPYDNLKGNETIPDVRATTLLICKSDITNNILILNVLARMTEGVLPEQVWRMIVGLNDLTIPLEWVVERLAQYLRLSFVTMFQFRVENLIVNILDTIDKQQVTRSYYTNTDRLLKILQLDTSTDALNTLMLLQNIRNSLHSNGVHNNPDLILTIDDCPFEFHMGQKVDCAGWAHIAIATRATIDVLYRILSAPKVKALPAPIVDHYIEKHKT